MEEGREPEVQAAYLGRVAVSANEMRDRHSSPGRFADLYLESGSEPCQVREKQIPRSCGGYGVLDGSLDMLFQSIEMVDMRKLSTISNERFRFSSPYVGRIGCCSRACQSVGGGTKGLPRPMGRGI